MDSNHSGGGSSLTICAAQKKNKTYNDIIWNWTVLLVFLGVNRSGGHLWRWPLHHCVGGRETPHPPEERQEWNPAHAVTKVTQKRCKRSPLSVPPCFLLITWIRFVPPLTSRFTSPLRFKAAAGVTTQLGEMVCDELRSTQPRGKHNPKIWSIFDFIYQNLSSLSWNLHRFSVRSCLQLSGSCFCISSPLNSVSLM